jgi:hypothetical protein
MYGVKRAVILPYLVFTDRQPALPSYPQSRMCTASTLESPEQFEPILDELAMRIAYDLMHGLLEEQKSLVHSLLK